MFPKCYRLSSHCGEPFSRHLNIKKTKKKKSFSTISRIAEKQHSTQIYKTQIDTQMSHVTEKEAESMGRESGSGG